MKGCQGLEPNGGVDFGEGCEAYIYRVILKFELGEQRGVRVTLNPTVALTLERDI